MSRRSRVRRAAKVICLVRTYMSKRDSGYGVALALKYMNTNSWKFFALKYWGEDFINKEK